MGRTGVHCAEPDRRRRQAAFLAAKRHKLSVIAILRHLLQSSHQPPNAEGKMHTALALTISHTGRVSLAHPLPLNFTVHVFYRSRHLVASDMIKPRLCQQRQNNLGPDSSVKC
jgi:hypothetical protein